MRTIFFTTLLALAGCASRISPPRTPDPGPAPSAEEEKDMVELVATLSADSPEAREMARKELEDRGLAAGPWLFAGAEAGDPERRTLCLAMLMRLRARKWKSAPPVDARFAVGLKKYLEPGCPMRGLAAWWIAEIASADEARQILPDPVPLLRDGDPEVRRCAAIVCLRLGMPARHLVEVLPELLEQVFRSRAAAEDSRELLISLSSASFDADELAEVREDLRKLVERARRETPDLRWWEVREFFRKAGPAAEPLLADILLKEPPGDLRRLAAISYGAGVARVPDLLAAWKKLPEDDVALALAAAGNFSGAERVASLLAHSPPGSRDRWATALALEKLTGRWHGNPADEEFAASMNALWARSASGAVAEAPVTFANADGGAQLFESGGRWFWEIACGPYSVNMITRDEPRWAVWWAPCDDASTGAEDLLLAWRLNRDLFWASMPFFTKDQQSDAGARLDRLIGECLAAATGAKADPTLEAWTRALKSRRAAARSRDAAVLSNRSTPDSERALAARRLATGEDADAALLAAFVGSKPSAEARTAAYLSLFQIGTEQACLALAENAADEPAKFRFRGFDVVASRQLLHLRLLEHGVDEADANGADPEKWAASVKKAFAPK